MNDSKKQGTSLLEDPCKRMVINLPFLLLPLLASSLRIRSDSRRSIELLSSRNKKIKLTKTFIRRPLHF